MPKQYGYIISLFLINKYDFASFAKSLLRLINKISNYLLLVTKQIIKTINLN